MHSRRERGEMKAFQKMWKGEGKERKGKPKERVSYNLAPRFDGKTNIIIMTLFASCSYCFYWLMDSKYLHFTVREWGLIRETKLPMQELELKI